MIPHVPSLSAGMQIPHNTRIRLQLNDYRRSRAAAFENHRDLQVRSGCQGNIDPFQVFRSHLDRAARRGQNAPIGRFIRILLAGVQNLLAWNNVPERKSLVPDIRECIRGSRRQRPQANRFK